MQAVMGLIANRRNSDHDWSLSWYSESYYGFLPQIRRFVTDNGRRFHFEVWIAGLRYWSEKRIDQKEAIRLSRKHGYLGSTKPIWIADCDWGEKQF